MNAKLRQDLRIFLLTLWQQVAPHEAHGAVFTLTHPATKLSTHIPGPSFLEALYDDSEFEDFAALIAKLNAEKDLRLNMGMRNFASIQRRDRRLVPRKICTDSPVRGGRADVAILPAFSIEIDIGDEGHAATADELPKSWEEVEAQLVRADVPLPTLLVKSGHGYHAHWVFEEPVYFFVDDRDIGNQQSILNQFRNFQAKITTGLGTQVDNTAGAEREWRLVSTYNRKIPERPRLVELVWATDALFDINALAPVKRRRTKRAAATMRAYAEIANHQGDPLDKLKAFLAAIPPDEDLHQPALLLLDGSFVTSKRHDTMLRLSNKIAWLAEHHGLYAAGLKDDQIIELFMPLFESWEEKYVNDSLHRTTVEKEVHKLSGMIEGARANYEYKKEKETQELANFRGGVREKRKEEFGEALPEAEKESEEGGEKDEAIPLIVRYKSEWYILNLLDGRYEERWFQKDEVVQIARQVWETEEGLANRIIKHVDERGREKDLAPEKLAEHPMVAGEIARSLRLSVMHETSYYDKKEQRFYIAHCPPRPDLDAVYHADIDRFIDILGGDKAEILRDWLAVLLRLDEPCAGLYLEGAPGVGKSLFVGGAASLWGKPATPFENFLGGRRSKFSNLEAPLVVLEEGVVDTYGITSQVRRFITATVHSVERKGKDPIFLDGCPRLVVAANNSDALNEPGIRHTQSDSLAIMERIFYVNVREETRDFLEGVDQFGNRRFSPDELNGWLVDGHFANHIAYLAVTRDVKRDRLYCAQKEMTDWHVNYLLSTNRIGSYVFEWIARFATDPVPFYQYASGSVSGNKKCESRIGGGEICLRSQELLDGWHVYMSKQIQLPSIQDVNMALETLCSRKGHTYIVQLDFLEKYVNKNQIGRWSLIKANLLGLAVVK